MNIVAQDSGKLVPSAPGQLAPMGYLGALRRQLEDRYPAQPMHQVRIYSVFSLVLLAIRL